MTFEKALESLKAFNAQEEKSSPSLFRFLLDIIQTKKVHRKRRVLVHNTLQHSIDIIRKHSLRIRFLEEGAHEERKCAEQFMAVIHQFNQRIEKVQKSWFKKHLFQWLGAGTDTLTPIIIHKIPSFHISTHEEQIVESIAKEIPVSPKRNEEEALHMKAVSLAKSENLPKSLQNSIFSALQKKYVPFTAKQLPGNKSSSLISLTKTLTSFPGETTEVVGTFKRIEKASIPIKDSFRVQTEARQTGFPHPKLYPGALGDLLIPHEPLHMDRLPTLKLFLKEKRAIAKELLPDGALNDQAKRLLESKAANFEKNREEIVSLYKQFLETDFFPDTFDAIATVFQSIHESLIKKPTIVLMDAWANHQEPLYSEDPKIRYAETKNILENTILNIKNIAPYSLKIAEGAAELTLQKFSEVIGYTAPLISNYAHKLQTLAFKQTLVFHSELLSSAPRKSLQDLLIEDISYFKEDTPSSIYQKAELFSNELEAYY